MFLSNALVHSIASNVVYNKTISETDIDKYCKQVSHLFLHNRDFRNQLLTCGHFNIFGYNISSPNTIYLPDNFIYEQRICAYNELSGSQINTLRAGTTFGSRKLIANHLHVSVPTTATHHKAANKLLGVQTDKQAIIVIQNF